MDSKASDGNATLRAPIKYGLYAFDNRKTSFDIRDNTERNLPIENSMAVPSGVYKTLSNIDYSTKAVPQLDYDLASAVENDDTL